MPLHDIKDTSPNHNLIKLLEVLLKEAKTGEIRSLFYVTSFGDDCISHGWSLDSRTSKRPMLSEMVMAQHDFVVNIELLEMDSVLARAVEE